uniref:Ig-like domain-containing protein n=1 Tax=Neolamprologus brichardi TaxID=32507 RepID=A0A3Q4H545_NEOBR
KRKGERTVPCGAPVLLLTLCNTHVRISNYSVVQQPTESEPVRPGDTVTLECSVLSESQACPGDYNVFWFRAGSQKSHPNIIYSDGNRKNECEKRSETQKRCIYRFSKNVSSSDAGTYYCAVATCGEIIFGNGSSVELVFFMKILCWEKSLYECLYDCMDWLAVKKHFDYFQSTDSYN